MLQLDRLSIGCLRTALHQVEQLTPCQQTSELVNVTVLPHRPARLLPSLPQTPKQLLELTDESERRGTLTKKTPPMRRTLMLSSVAEDGMTEKFEKIAVSFWEQMASRETRWSCRLVRPP